MRCNSIGSVAIAASALRKPSRASAHLPCRALASARQSGASCWLPTKRVRQILERRVGAADHDVGDGAQHQRRSSPRRSADCRRARRRAPPSPRRTCRARDRSARDRSAPAGAWLPAQPAAASDQLDLALGEIGLAVEAPGLRVEHVALGRAPASPVSPPPTAMSPPGREITTLSADKLGAEVVGERLHRDAVRGGQRAELDEILRLEEAARGRERRDHEERVADVGILEAVQAARRRRSGW